MILFSIVSLDLMRVRARVGRPQFLKLQLICALSHNALSWIDTADNRNLVTVLIAGHDIAAVKLLTRAQDVDDLLSFVIENGFLGYKQDPLLSPTPRRRL